MSSYQLTSRAEGNLLDLFLYGLEQFGVAQAERYQMGLEHRFRILADNPRLGRAADTIAPGVRRHEYESHVILYEPTETGVLILALVHGRSIRHLQL